MSADVSQLKQHRHSSSVDFGALRPSNLFSSITVGVVIFLIALLIGTSFSAFIFHGRLAPFVGSGIVVFLVSSIVLNLSCAVFSSDKGVVPSPQDTPVVILGAMTANLVSLAGPAMSDTALFASVVATIVLASLVSGLCFFFIGVLRISNLVRYIPYPVIGGVLAGVGWLLLQGATTVLVGEEASLLSPINLLSSEQLFLWLPVLIPALALVVYLRRSNNVFVLPIVIIAVLLVFFLGQALGLLPEQARLVPEADSLASASDSTLHLLNSALWSQVDISLVLSQAGGIAVVTVFSTLNLLAYSSGIELIVGRELDFNRELTVAGIANLLSGLLGGGLVGYATVAYSTLTHRAGGNGRVVNLVVAFLLILVLLLGTSIITIFPRPILGGVLMFLGLTLLVEWLYDSRRHMPLHDYFIVGMMMLVIAALGLLWGIACGILFSVIFFVLQYSQIHVVRQQFAGDKYRSNTDRSALENRLLQESGERILIFRLQGYIFFGTGFQLYQHVRAHILAGKSREIQFIILDFRLVERVDISTVMDFTKLRHLAKTRGIHVLVTNTSKDIRDVLASGSYSLPVDDIPYVFSDLDHALEWCEDRILADAKLDEIYHVPIADHFGNHAMVRQLEIDRLKRYMVQVEAKVGDYIAHQGDKADAMYFIESGKVDILLANEHGEVVRLRSMGAGTIVGEIGFYLSRERSATIVVTEAGVFYKIDRNSLHQMEENEPQAAVTFHAFISCVLSERLTATNRMVESLMD